MPNTAPIHLSVPAEPQFARTVRMLAANLAVLEGMSVDVVEDMRMAAEECFVWCCATKPESVEIAFSLSDGFKAEFSLGEASLVEDSQAATYAELILAAVCDEYSCDAEAGLLTFTKRTDALEA